MRIGLPALFKQFPDTVELEAPYGVGWTITVFRADHPTVLERNLARGVRFDGAVSILLELQAWAVANGRQLEGDLETGNWKELAMEAIASGGMRPPDLLGSAMERNQEAADLVAGWVGVVDDAGQQVLASREAVLHVLQLVVEGEEGPVYLGRDLRDAILEAGQGATVEQRRRQWEAEKNSARSHGGAPDGEAVTTSTTLQEG